MSQARTRAGSGYFLIMTNVVLLIVNVAIAVVLMNLHGRVDAGCARGNVMREDMRMVLESRGEWAFKASNPALDERPC